MFWRRKKPGMDPNSAHLISFALEVGMDEVEHLIEVANERGLSSASERLGQHRNALAKTHAEFSVTSENLQEMANQTEVIAAHVAEIEQVLEVSENDQSFHVALATSHLATAAKIARGEF